MGALIDQLPRYDHFIQRWHHSVTNWLPFYWNGFSQTTRYTYVLPSLNNERLLWAGLSDSVRGDIRKASRRFELEVRTDMPLGDFLSLNRMTFSRQGRPLPYPEDIVRRIDEACIEHACRRIFVAYDSSGNAHAAVYLVWDENSAYYLMSGSKPELRNSGAVSLCLWESIRFAATVTKSFDFEGSMIEPIERHFRKFGALQRPYFEISRTPSKILRLKKTLKAYLR